MTTADRAEFCTFYVRDYLFGIEVGLVREILRAQKITRVPLAHAMFAGLINLRGQIVTTVDLRRRLQIQADETASGESINIVVQIGRNTVNFLADQVSEVVEVERHTLEAVPETLQGAARLLVRGVYQLPEQLLLILNSELVLDSKSV